MPKHKIDSIIDSLPSDLLEIYSCVLKEFLENIQTDLVEYPDRLFKWVSTFELIRTLRENYSLLELTTKLFKIADFDLIYPKDKTDKANVLWVLTEFEGFEHDKTNENFYVRKAS